MSAIGIRRSYWKVLGQRERVRSWWYKPRVLEHCQTEGERACGEICLPNRAIDDQLQLTMARQKFPTSPEAFRLRPQRIEVSKSGLENGQFPAHPEGLYSAYVITTLVGR